MKAEPASELIDIRPPELPVSGLNWEADESVVGPRHFVGSDVPSGDIR
jgi:hypothetical protein